MENKADKSKIQTVFIQVVERPARKMKIGLSEVILIPS